MSAGGDLIRQAYDAFARGDIPGVLELVADDVQWDVTETLPQGGSFSGRDAVGGFFQRLGELYEEINIDVEDLVDGESVVAGVGIARGALREGGPVEYGFAHVFSLSGGEVVRFREYADRTVG
jgi:ketosteroid isomerase-like protein